MIPPAVRAAIAATLLLPATLPAQTDARLQRVPYVSGAVVTVRVVPGYVATVTLSPDERIENVAVGNSAAWEVTPSKSGDHLFIKPMAAGATTNVAIVTDTREYNLLLQTTFEGDPQAAFRITFDYPREPASPPAAETLMPADRSPVAARVATNTYRISGNRLARPQAVDDDGSRTRFVFAGNATMPAIYAVDAEGNEALVTARQEADAWVIDRVWPRYILRVGHAKAEARRIVPRDAR